MVRLLFMYLVGVVLTSLCILTLAFLGSNESDSKPETVIILKSSIVDTRMLLFLVDYQTTYETGDEATRKAIRKVIRGIGNSNRGRNALLNPGHPPLIREWVEEILQ